MATAWVKDVEPAGTVSNGYQLRVTVNLFGGGAAAAPAERRDVVITVLRTDTTAQITTKVANAIIADAAVAGLTIVGADIKGG
jgi:hypothetical protein